MISLILIFGCLCRSSSWRPWPHIGGCRLVWPLLRPQMTVWDHFFCKICFQWVWRGQGFFFRVILVIFGDLVRSFSRALDGFSNLRGVSQICGGIHVWYVALKNVFGGIYRISYVSRLFMTYILPIQTFKTFVQGEINKILQKSGVEKRHLVVELTILGPQEAD